MDSIKKYWEQQAETHGVSHWASWGDHYAIDLEIQTIGQYITSGDSVLDVGCANGFATLQHLDKGLRSIIGIDFSEKMIARANENKQHSNISEKVSFETGDVRSLHFADNAFDVVCTTRVLINLPTWEEQLLGLDECIRVCRKDGTVILSEGFWEPLMILNAFRALVSLPPLVEHDFNRYLKKRRLEQYLDSRNIRYEVNDFSSIYYLGSRLLRELVTNPDDYPGYSNPINAVFHDIEKQYSGGGFGIQQAYILRK